MIEKALYSISPFEREIWLRCAMALKSELGEGGFELWDRWSQQADNYREKDARAVWRSVKPFGGITIKSLYQEARKNGWRGEENAKPIKVDQEALRCRQKAQQAQNERRHKKAALDAQNMLKRAQIKPHEYLERKGFPQQTGFVLGTQLLIPMRDHKTNAIVGLQRIEPWGTKKFLSGTRAKGAVFNLGQGYETYLCEGYATALSVLEALKSLYRQARVVVTFSAANMAHVAGLLCGKRYLIADHDESGTGERYAAQTGLPFWMPPDVGQDANDFYLAHGVRALAVEINKLRRQ